MLTVKHVYSGVDAIYSASKVVFIAKKDDRPARVIFDGGAGGQMISLQDGLVYIMNSDGKTVSKYVLDLINRDSCNAREEPPEPYQFKTGKLPSYAYDRMPKEEPKRPTLEERIAEIRKAEISVVSSVRFAVEEMRVMKSHSAITGWLDFIDKCLQDYRTATTLAEKGLTPAVRACGASETAVDTERSAV